MALSVSWAKPERLCHPAQMDADSTSVHLDRLKLGVCYYPEQWPERLWADDFRRMRELGLEIVRMAEFAWTVFEPKEGRFSFDLFDRAIDLAAQHGLKVILGTPTATPPAWLTHRYPETLNVSRDGIQYRHGARRHYTYNAPAYRRLCAAIVRELAAHYGGHPTVIGWQIDNELNCEIDVFYSDADQIAFRDWAKGRYETLDRLNQAWGAVFWNQTYTDWDQVRLIGPTPHRTQNPHQALDEKRFFSDSAISFAALQAEILRELAPGQWITTNGTFGHLDSHRLTEDVLDVFSHDSYPNFSTIPEWLPTGILGELKDRRWSWDLSVARSISPNFVVMEQQSGPGGWIDRIPQPAPKPGQMRLWTYQSIAHGADMVLFYRWRTATQGTEIYWHGINDHHDRPNRRLAEVTEIGREIGAIGSLIAGTRVVAEAAIVTDYDNEWDGEADLYHGPFAQASQLAWFTALQGAHVPVDALYLRPRTTLADLARYRLLVYPHPAILTAETAGLLTDYVRGGGTIVFGARTGYKDLTGQVAMEPLPGPVAELCGVTVIDSTRIAQGEAGPRLTWTGIFGPVTHAGGFNEVLQVDAPGARVLAEYADDYYTGSPALVQNVVGDGSVFFFGAVFNVDIAARLIGLAGLTSPVADWLELPPEVELAIRERPETGERFVFLLNYGASEAAITVRAEALEILSGRRVEGAVSLPAFDVRILSIPR